MDPTGYTVNYSFTGFQNNSPTTPLPAPKLDIELDNIETSIASIISAITDVRREDGALNNGIVTFDSLALAVQLMLNPDDATLVANAVAAAQAAASAAGGSASAAAVSAAQALASAIAAAASAASIDLSLFLPKAGNLAGLGNINTALTNLNAAKWDGTNQIGRLAELTGGAPITDWNSVLKSGWYSCGSSATNSPVAGIPWAAQVIAVDALYVTQIAYPYVTASLGAGAAPPWRRHAYDNAGVLTWTTWVQQVPVPVGTSILVNANTPPAGFLKENGALISRATYPNLTAFALASGNIVSEAAWAANNFGAFSTGDLSTTIRLPDMRGEFVRAWDDSRGVDTGRGLGTWQQDTLKDHTHSYSTFIVGAQKPSGTGSQVLDTSAGATTGSPSTGAATDTKPRNLPKLFCIKY